MVTKTKKPHGKNLRKGRFSEPGRIYAITVVTRNRQPIFQDFTLARFLIGILRRHEEMEFAQTLSFVVMPDHFHWLMKLGHKQNLSQVARGVKSIFSKKAGRSVFQKGFYDHAVRQDEDIQEISRYMVMNPVRAGLVTHYNDYPHWDAIWVE